MDNGQDQMCFHPATNLLQALVLLDSGFNIDLVRKQREY